MNTQDCKIYLGDLTYDTVALSNEVFPLNIGYIAAYCYKRFGHKINITLFKYIEDLEKAILENPPDILGLSNYAWNTNLGYEMFRIFSQVNSNASSEISTRATTSKPLLLSNTADHCRPKPPTPKWMIFILSSHESFNAF